MNRSTLYIILLVVALLCAVVAAAKDFGWFDLEPIHAFGWLALAAVFAIAARLVTAAPPARPPT